jgi:hypothetical protein
VKTGAAGSPQSIPPEPNFEKALGEMIALAHWMTPPPYGNALRQMVGPDIVPGGLSFPEGAYGTTVTMHDQLTFLMVQLAQHMRGLCAKHPVAAHASFPA